MKPIEQQNTSQDKQPPRILLAVQAGGNYGSGHLERCKTIAQTLEADFNAQVTFWLETVSNTLKLDLVDEGYNVIQNNWSLPEAVRQEGFNRLVIDFSSAVTPSLIQRIRNTVPDLSIIVLDNHGLGCTEVDAIIFPNAHSKPNTDKLANGNSIYQGAEYIVLGHSVLTRQKKDMLPDEGPLDKPVVLVAMGAHDPELITEKVLDAFSDLKDCHIDLVVPGKYPFPDHLEKIASRLPSTVTLHWRTTSLRPLIQRATVAVAALGLTAYELAYFGVPAIIIGHYPAQVEDMERFAKLGSAISLGWGRNLDKDSLYELVLQLLEEPERRQAMSEKGKALMDASGPVRVSQVIVNTVRNAVPLAQE
jgi:spore coat polysaccharide biosynthesis predicted glycosyltransferase SpsG